MWWLVSKGTKYPLLVGKEYIIGRKDGDITVPSDQSLSRKHATAVVHHPEGNVGLPHKAPELHIKDTSKLGTLLLNERFIKQTRTVKSGSQVMFGTGGESTFTAIYEPFLVTTSCLDTAGKRAIKATVHKLGGHLVNEWRKECNLLVMSTLSVTIKVICALVSQKDIVTLKYLEDMMDALQAKAKLPNPHDYIPALIESQLNPEDVSFKPHIPRKTLFQGKIFIFLTPKQFQKLSMAVELAGGTPMLMEEGSDLEEEMLTDKCTCVMTAEVDPVQMSQNAVQWITYVMQLLQKAGKRAILDSELGYAVLHSSTEKFCNPAVPFEEPVGRAPQSQSLAHATSMSLRTVPPSQIKQEPSSQAVNTSIRNKRRLESSEEHSVSVTKSRRIDPGPASIIEIKPEQGTSRDDQPGKRIELPRPSIVKQNTSAAPICDFPDTPRNNTTNDKAISDEIEEFDFDSIPSRRKKRKECEPSNPENLVITEESSHKKHTETMKIDLSPNNEDLPINFDFDALPKRKGRNRNTSDCDTKSHSPVIPSTIDCDGFENIPSRKGRRKATAAVESVKEEQLDDNFNNLLQSRPKRSRAPKDEPMEDLLFEESDKKPLQKGSLANSNDKPSECVQVKENVSVAQSDEDIIQNTERAINHSPRARSDEMFLTTTKPIGDQVKKQVYQEEADVGDGKIQVLETSLVVNRSGKGPVKWNSAAECNTWKGKVVKNFKKFKKSGQAAATKLPRIIGGSDLTVHESKPRQELEDFFKESVETDLQQTQLQREANNLFDWDPPSKKKRKR